MIANEWSDTTLDNFGKFVDYFKLKPRHFSENLKGS